MIEILKMYVHLNTNPFEINEQIYIYIYVMHICIKFLNP